MDRRHAIVLFLLGLVLGALLGPGSAAAQTAMRMFGTQSTGVSRAIVVNSSGAVVVKLQ
jgi:hypothetical protein